MKMNAITPQNTLRNTMSQKAEQGDFSTAILGKTLQNQIVKSVPDERSRARFTATLIEMVSSNSMLQKCTPASVVSAALRGEGMGLIMGHGYYVVPYGDKATYITSYRGYIALAMASGMYADIDCMEVREGEFKGRDRRTGKQTIDFSVYDTDEERNEHPIIGYYAYFELKDGFFRSEYWDMGKLLEHAAKYSPAFDIKMYEKMMNGTLTEQEKNRIEKGSPWYTSTDRMCKKTVLRSLLNSGYAPLSNEVKSFISNDTDYAISDSTVSRDNDPLIIDMPEKPKKVDSENKALKSDLKSEGKESSTTTAKSRPAKATDGKSTSVNVETGEIEGQMNLNI